MGEPRGGDPGKRQRLNQAIDEYMRTIRRKEKVAPEALIAKYPDVADELRKFLKIDAASPSPSTSRWRSVGQSTPGGSAAANRAPAPASPPAARGAALPRSGRLGDFELLEEIGRGGMGVVYKARQVNLKGRVVAVKVLLAGLFASPTEVQRFLGDAEKAGKLQHPQIVRVHSRAREKDLHYFAMDYIAGENLHQVAQRKRFSVEAAAQVVETVARAIHFAHEHGIIHRDLKPSNILIDARHGPIITDFGLAKQIDGETINTRTGDVLGTPGYMPPEQAAGEHRELDRTCDVYSLGAVLYELLTGDPPFHGKTPWDTLWLVQNVEPQSPRRLNGKVPADIATICLKCLQKEKVQRYQTAQALADDLLRFRRGEPIQARPVGIAERAWKRCRRAPAISSLLALTVVAVCAAAFAILSNDAPAVAPRELVNSLLVADTAQVPELLKKLSERGPESLAALRELSRRDDLTAKERTRVGLGLLKDDPEQVEVLREQLLTADHGELLLIRTALAPHAGRISGWLWERADDAAEPEDRRFRAAAALAEFDPASTRWTGGRCDTIASSLLSQEPRDALAWSELFRPVRKSLVAPLQRTYRDEQSSERRTAVVRLLAEFAGDQPPVLVDLAMTADPPQFAIVLPKLQAQSEPATRLLTSMLNDLAPGQPIETVSASQAPPVVLSDADNRRLSRVAVILLHLNTPAPVWPMFREAAAPQLRHDLIHELAPLDVDPRQLIAQLAAESDSSARQALILSLGEYATERVPADAKEALVGRLLDAYANDSDAGSHSAIDWLFGRWNISERLDVVKGKLAAQTDVGERGWFVNSLGDVLAVVPGPQEYWMEGYDPQHLRRIPRTFAISTREVTQAQFDTFRRELDGSAVGVGTGPDQERRPLIGVNWHEAARYCLWLSRRDGIPDDQLCYRVSDVDKSSCEVFPDYLLRTGYRLPTNAEWELACRAGTSTVRFFGSDQRLIGNYAWLSETEGPSPVGRLKPNPWGLFDVYGNAAELCSDSPGSLRQFVDMWAIHPDASIDDVGGGEAGPNIAVRGGGFDLRGADLRSAAVQTIDAGNRGTSVGLRLARTIATAPDAQPPAFEPVDRSQLKELAVISVAGIAQLEDRMGFLIGLSQRTRNYNQLVSEIRKNARDPGKLASNRFGCILQTDGERMLPIFFMSFESESQALAGAQALFPLQQALGDGIHRFHGTPQMYFRFADGRGYLAPTYEQLAGPLPTLDPAAESQLATYDMVLTFRPENLIDQVADAMAAAILKALGSEIEHVTLGFRIDRETRTASLDAMLHGRSGSSLSNSVAQWGDITSRFEQLRAADAPGKLALTIRLDKWMQRELQNLLAEARTSIGDDENTFSIVDVAERLVSEGTVDAAMFVELREGLKAGATFAAHLPGADQAEELVMHNLSQNETPVDRNVDQYKGWRIHEVRMDVDESLREFFPGERVALQFAFSKDAVVMQMGGDGLQGVRQVIDGVARPGARGTPVPRFVFENAAIGEPDLSDPALDASATSFLLSAWRASMHRDNRFRVTIDPAADHLRLRMEVEVGFLRYLGEASAYGLDIATGSLIPGAPAAAEPGR